MALIRERKRKGLKYLLAATCYSVLAKEIYNFILLLLSIAKF